MKENRGQEIVYDASNIVEFPIRLSGSEAQRLAELLGANIPRQPNTMPSPEACHAAARRLLKMYRTRATALGDLCSDAPWIMLLDLYVAHYLKRDIGISSVCIASLAPPTTALRHLHILIDQGLVRRIRPEHDARLVYVELTPKGMKTMTKLVDVMA
jgi:DNA-binding MarR family transcriptional regulator